MITRKDLSSKAGHFGYAASVLGLAGLPTNAHAQALASSSRLLILGELALIVALVLYIVLLVRKLNFYERELNRTKYNTARKFKSKTEQLSRKNVSLIEEVAKYQEAEALINATKQYYESILDSMPSVVIGLTNDLKISLWNNAARLSTGLTPDQAQGQSIRTALPGIEPYWQTLENAIEETLPILLEGVKFDLADQSHFVDLHLFPLLEPDSGMVIRLDDVTQRAQAEAYIVQNEKLLSLGEMAAGLAHEINNPLSAISNNVQTIQRRTSTSLAMNHEVASQHGLDLERLQHYFDEREIPKCLNDIRSATERAANIVKGVLNFAHTGDTDQAPEQINALIQDVVELDKRARQSSSKAQTLDHQVTTKLQATPDTCLCSPPEIQQVILNLIRNAVQAAESIDTAANITISTANQLGLIVIRVHDNGPGIPEVDLPHIFDPFFTTKAVGQGTGLGLSVSYLIITEHHSGTLEVTSDPVNGTEFTIKLPQMSD